MALLRLFYAQELGVGAGAGAGVGVRVGVRVGLGVGLGLARTGSIGAAPALLRVGELLTVT